MKGSVEARKESRELAEQELGEAWDLPVHEKLLRDLSLDRLVLIEVPRDVRAADQFDVSLLNGLHVSLGAQEPLAVTAADGTEFVLEAPEKKTFEFIRRQLTPLLPTKQDKKQLAFKRSSRP